MGRSLYLSEPVLAIRLAEVTCADREVVEAAAWLHDVAKEEGRDHGRDGAAAARRILAEMDYPPHKVETVAEECRTAARGCTDCKSGLAAIINEHLADVREKRREIIEAPDTLRDILEAGARQAAEVAEATMQDVRKATGWKERW